MQAIIGAFRDRIKQASAGGASIRVVGGATKDFYGQTLVGATLDTTLYSGIVDYDPTELVITARCGTPIADLERAMNERGQYLAFDAPRFGPGGTLGGVIAAGLSGPRRQAVGAVRDFVLGVRMMDGKGDVLTFGGQVIKNVAGFDVSRLLVGSLGTLGLLLDMSLKALPLPVAEETLKLGVPEDQALDLMNRWSGKPFPISATAHSNGDLYVRLSGARAAVRSARATIGGERVDAAAAVTYWAGIRDHVDPFFRAVVQSDAPLWRVSVPSTAPALALPGAQLIEWGGALRWLATSTEAATIRDAAKRVGGHATLFRGGDKSVGVFQPLEPTLDRLHRKLKGEFDPASIFNRGRMYQDW